MSESGREMWLLPEKSKLSYKSFSINSPYSLSLKRRETREKDTDLKGFTYTKHRSILTGRRTSITWAMNARMIRRRFLSTYIVLWFCNHNQDKIEIASFSLSFYSSKFPYCIVLLLQVQLELPFEVFLLLVWSFTFPCNKPCCIFLSFSISLKLLYYYTP